MITLRSNLFQSKISKSRNDGFGGYVYSSKRLFAGILKWKSMIDGVAGFGKFWNLDENLYSLSLSLSLLKSLMWVKNEILDLCDELTHVEDVNDDTDRQKERESSVCARQKKRWDNESQERERERERHHHHHTATCSHSLSLFLDFRVYQLSIKVNAEHNATRTHKKCQPIAAEFGWPVIGHVLYSLESNYRMDSSNKVASRHVALPSRT